MNAKRKLVITCISGAIGLSTAIGVAAAAGGVPEAPAAGPPALLDTAVPAVPPSLGVGERLLLVVANGSYPSMEAAEAANAAYAFGELQGFYAVPTEQFAGVRSFVRGRDAWLLVSAFRTQEGAISFADTARLAGAQVTITGRVTSLPGEFAGLGQEASPDGRGPLNKPIPASMPETAAVGV